MNSLYPVTIITARYQGSYEGGLWCAFNLYELEVPPEATGNDIACYEFWHSPNAAKVGRGATPDEALADLTKRLEETQ